MANEEIIWNEIPRFIGKYQFGSDGTIKCLPKRANHYREIITRGTIHNTGYYIMTINDIYGVRIHEKVHRLIGQAHIPNPENKPCINHKNGIKTDNRISNLEWCTHAENKEHARISGLMKRNENSPVSKLSNKEAKFIFDSKLPHYELAKMFNITSTTVYAIKTGRTWFHLTSKVFNKKNRLNRDIVLNIFNSDLSYNELSSIYNIPYATVSAIKTGQAYSRFTNKKYNPNVRANISLVLEIFNCALPIHEICKKYNKRSSYVCSIKNGAKWSSVTGKIYKRQTLTKEHVLEIYKSELSYRELSNKFNVDKRTVSGIKTGYRSSNITGKKWIKSK